MWSNMVRKKVPLTERFSEWNISDRTENEYKDLKEEVQLGYMKISKELWCQELPEATGKQLRDEAQGTSLLVQWLRLPSKAGCVSSVLVWKLRVHMPCGQKTKTENRNNVVTNSVKTLKTVHIRKEKTKDKVRSW